MHRLARYVIALIVGGAITTGVATEYHSVMLLTGIFQVFTVAIAILLRYPSLMWRTDSETRWPAAAFAGGTTFGFLSLAQGIGVKYHFGAGVLGFGLALLGMSVGIWMGDVLKT